MKIKFNPLTGGFDLVSVETPGGDDTQVQFNDDGEFGGDSGFTFNKTTGNVGIGTDSPIVDLTLQQGANAYSQLWGTSTATIALGIASDSSKISGMDFKNTNSEGQVRLMARNNNNNYIAMNAMGSTSNARFFGQHGDQLLLFGYGKRMAIGTFTSDDIIFGTYNTERMRLKDNGNFGIGITAPTALLHIKAGTTTNPPLKLTAGTALTTPETGSMEFHDSRFYITNKSNRKAIDRTGDVKLTTTTVENTITETTVFTASVPANSWVAGNVLNMEMFGDISNTAVSNDVTIRAKIGGVTIATLVTNGRKLTNACWVVTGKAIIRTVGTTGEMAWTMNCKVDGQDRDFACSVDTHDTTGALDLTITAEWDAAKAGNVFKCTGGDMTYKN